jgi:hypothetical protein
MAGNKQAKSQAAASMEKELVDDSFSRNPMRECKDEAPNAR